MTSSRNDEQFPINCVPGVKLFPFAWKIKGKKYKSSVGGGFATILLWLKYRIQNRLTRKWIYRQLFLQRAPRYSEIITKFGRDQSKLKTNHYFLAFPCIFQAFRNPICLSIYLSIYLSVCLSICLSIYLPIYLPTYLSIYLSTYLCTYLPTYLPIYLPTYLPIYLSTYLSIYLSIYLPIYLSTYLSICLSVCLSVCTYLSIFFIIYLSIYLSVSVCLYLPTYLFYFI